VLLLRVCEQIWRRFAEHLVPSSQSDTLLSDSIAKLHHDMLVVIQCNVLSVQKHKVWKFDQ
jgi:hypothetical protein